jgi:hypothetical protein
MSAQGSDTNVKTGVTDVKTGTDRYMRTENDNVPYASDDARSGRVSPSHVFLGAGQCQLKD